MTREQVEKLMTWVYAGNNEAGREELLVLCRSWLEQDEALRLKTAATPKFNADRILAKSKMLQEFKLLIAEKDATIAELLEALGNVLKKEWNTTEKAWAVYDKTGGQ